MTYSATIPVVQLPDGTYALRLAQIEENFQILSPLQKVQPYTVPGDEGKILRIATDGSLEWAAVTSGFEIVQLTLNENAQLDDTNSWIGQSTGGIIQKRFVTVRHSTDYTQPVNLYLPSNPVVGQEWIIHVDPAQTGQVVIHAPTGVTIDDGSSQVMDGPGAVAVISVVAANTVKTHGATGSPQSFSGKTLFKDEVELSGVPLYGNARMTVNVATNRTLKVTSTDASDLGTVLVTTAAVTITIPAPVDWKNPGEVIVWNPTGNTVTITDGTNSTTVGANQMCRIFCDGGNIVLDTTTPTVW